MSDEIDMKCGRSVISIKDVRFTIRPDRDLKEVEERTVRASGQSAIANRTRVNDMIARLSNCEDWFTAIGVQ